MTVTQNLYPKRKGIIAAYQQVHATRLARVAANHASSQDESADSKTDIVTTDFVTAVTNIFPTLYQILELGLLLFSGNRVNSTPNQPVPPASSSATSVSAQPQSSLFKAHPATVSVTSSGLSVYLNSQRELHHAVDKTRQEVQLGVTIVPGWLCVYGHEAKLIFWDDGPGNRAFDPTWQEMRDHSANFRQCIKWSDGDGSGVGSSGVGRALLSSIVKRGTGEEAKAEEEGWWVLT